MLLPTVKLDDQMKAPYLIQRAEIQTPLAEPNTRLSQAVSFEYMGSAEFEFGALPNSFRAIEALAADWKCRLVPEITEDGSPLRVYSAFTAEEFDEYVAFLKRLRDPNGRCYLKEASHFDEGHRQRWKYSRTNFWWDIDNHAMFSFHKEFMNRLLSYVAASIDYMNEQKAKK